MDDKTLLIAASLAQWDTALTHLRILQRAGSEVGDVRRVARERHLLALRLTTLNNMDGNTDPDVVVEEARRMCTQNQSRLDDLLREKE
jgi:hypothetical protein